MRLAASARRGSMNIRGKRTMIPPQRLLRMGLTKIEVSLLPRLCANKSQTRLPSAAAVWLRIAAIDLLDVKLFSGQRAGLRVLSPFGTQITFVGGVAAPLP